MRIQIASRNEDDTGSDIATPCQNGRNAIARDAAGWLCLAATPTFTVMALLTTHAGGDAICSTMPNASPLHGMAPMYGLMSAFHAAPWLKLMSRRKKKEHRGFG